MGWEDIRTRLIASYEKAKRAGEVDEPVLPYLELINSIPSLATSSSCYGRIVLIDIPTGLKKDSRFLAKWHKKIEFQEFWDSLEKCVGKRIWMQFDPLILHISAKDIQTARRVLLVKNRAGIKRGGIFSIGKDRVQIEVEGTQKMGLPVKFDGKILIDEDYAKLLVEEANKKMERNAKSWERFEKEFRQEFSKELDLEPK